MGMRRFWDWLTMATPAEPTPEPEIQSWEKLANNDLVILLSNGKAYRGSCTIWRSVEDATTPPYWIADQLIRNWKLIEWGLLAAKRREGLWRDICAAR